MDESKANAVMATGQPTQGQPTANVSTPKSPERLTDALATWDAETGAAAPSGLSAIRLDGSEKLLIPFTTSMERVVTHFLDFPALRGYVRCSGAACLLCRIGREREQRDLLPVYDPLDRAVAVLAISPSVRAHALRPQLIPALRQVQDDQRVLVSVRKPEWGRYEVSIHRLQSNADDGADKIVQFLDEFKAGRVELASVFPQPAVEDLATIPEIATLMRMKGITS